MIRYDLLSLFFLLFALSWWLSVVIAVITVAASVADTVLRVAEVVYNGLSRQIVVNHV